MRISVFLASILLAACSNTVTAAKLEVDALRADLDHPWGLAFLPNGDFLITERSGRLKRLNADGSLEAIIDGVPDVVAQGQGGLLDVALHPDFAENRYVYLTWSGQCEKDGNATHLGRGRLIDHSLRDFTTLFVATPCVDSRKHFGSRLVFDRDGYLFMTVGERGQRERAQDTSDHNGSVLRLNADGSIPDDNPFVDTANARPAIYSYGHRNPQGADLHPRSGKLWINEHGPRGGDEINIPEPGANFGWPLATYGKEYWGPEIGPDTYPGTIGPLYYWVPSIATSGMAFYDHERFPQWRGKLFIGGLSGGYLAMLTLEGRRVTDEQKLLAGRGWRIRDVRQGPDGYLYVLTDHRNGRLLRLSPVPE